VSLLLNTLFRPHTILRKVNIGFVVSGCLCVCQFDVRPSVRPYETYRLPEKEIYEILYLSIFRKYVQKIQF